MNALVIYDSLHGNTKEIADTIVGVFKEFGDVKIEMANVVTTSDFTGIDFLAVGGPTHGHGLSADMKDLLDRLPADKLVDLPTVTFDTRLNLFSWLSGSAAVSSVASSTGVSTSSGLRSTMRPKPATRCAPLSAIR